MYDSQDQDIGHMDGRRYCTKDNITICIYDFWWDGEPPSSSYVVWFSANNLALKCVDIRTVCFHHVLRVLYVDW